MKLHEVLTDKSVISGESWFRPVSMRGTRLAYCLKDGGKPYAAVCSVPSARGGDLGISYYADILAGDWEVVTPDEVLGGYKS